MVCLIPLVWVLQLTRAYTDTWLYFFLINCNPNLWKKTVKADFWLLADSQGASTAGSSTCVRSFFFFFFFFFSQMPFWGFVSSWIFYLFRKCINYFTVVYTFAQYYSSICNLTSTLSYSVIHNFVKLPASLTIQCLAEAPGYSCLFWHNCQSQQPPLT